MRKMGQGLMAAVAVVVMVGAVNAAPKAGLAASEATLEASAVAAGDARDGVVSQATAGERNAGTLGGSEVRNPSGADGDRGPDGDRGRPDGQGPPDDRGRPDRDGGTPDASGPFDYIAQASQLSQPEYATQKFSTTVAGFDSDELYVEVTLPARNQYPDRQWPVILEASPYHGTLADREGIRIFPDAKDGEGNHVGLTGYFAPRGYAVVMMDLRGTGQSSGCLDHLGPNDAKDLKTVVEWAASQPWSSGEVGMTGHSYVGSTPSVAAAQNPEGLVTIAPSAGLASMYDHQFHRGVPWLLQWAGPIFAYPQLSLERDLPGGEHVGERPEQTGCGVTSSAVTAGHGQFTGQWQAWHTVRDHRQRAAAWDGPIFMIHGVNDNAARIPAAEWFFADRTPTSEDKVWIGQWDHGSAGATTCAEAESVGHVNCRFDQWKYALHAWFDRHLQHREVETGPTVEAFLNGQTVTTAERWESAPGALTLYPDASDGSLKLEVPDEAGSQTFTAVAGEGATEFVSAPLEDDAVFLGLPRLDLEVATTTSQVLHVVTTLSAVDADGARRTMNHCATNTHLRHDVRTPEPVVPREPMALELQCFAMAHQLAAGERLVLSVGTSSPHHVPTHTLDAEVVVHTGPATVSGYTLPLDLDAAVFPDVERFAADGDELVLDGPAQAPESGSVLVPAPGAGVAIEPVTAAAYEFTVEEGFDNVTLEVLATPATPADIDLTLQRRSSDGAWSDALATGTSGSLEQETLTYQERDGIDPGDYRVLVHNWVGGPTDVELELTFANGAGEPGA